MPVKRGKKLELVRRRQRIADLYIKGETQCSIAEHLEVSQALVCSDLQHIRSEWRASAARDFDAARDLELQKIDRIEREAWAAWERSQKPSQSAVVAGEGTERARTRKSIKNQHGDPRFLDQINKCIAQRRAILGLDALPPSLENGSDVDATLATRRDRIVTVIATLRDRERAGSVGEGLGPTLTSGVRSNDEPGQMANGAPPRLAGSSDR